MPIIDGLASSTCCAVRRSWLLSDTALANFADQQFVFVGILHVPGAEDLSLVARSAHHTTSAGREHQDRACICASSESQDHSSRHLTLNQFWITHTPRFSPTLGPAGE
ncbi:hypothetical protein B0H14DRAFT_3438584 [Mycena olivaceomarginata]|nr:hypothetical protein B0H14DRAFT_3438584 [Mycena olivaceomarginata]